MLIGLIGFTLYIGLNREKPEATREHVQQFLNGKPLDILILETQAGEQIKIALPSSDVFQRDSGKQINFFRLASTKWPAIFHSSMSNTYWLNGDKIVLQPTVDQDFIRIELPKRILYILREKDLATMARLIKQYRQEPVLSQTCEGELCKGVRVNLSGLEPAQGPFLDSDPIPLHRGLPAGRWIRDSRFTITITSQKEGLLRMHLSLLAPFEKIQPRVMGLVKTGRRIKGGVAVTDHGFGSLWRHDLDVLVQLIPGANQFSVTFDKAMEYKDRQTSGRTAGYLTAVRFGEPDPQAVVP